MDSQRQNDSPQQLVYRESQEIFGFKKSSQNDDFVRSPQILYEFYSEDPIQLELFRNMSQEQQQQHLRQEESQRFINVIEQPDQTQEEKDSNLGLEQEQNQEQSKINEQHQQNIHTLQKKQENEEQAFKYFQILQNDPSEIQKLQQQPCNCKNSGCLKRYCRCFHSGRMCLKECQCSEDCQNNEQHQEQRNNAIIHVDQKCYRNRRMPRDALFKLDVIYGCSCTKSKCRKRYCECYLRNQKCTDKCKCFDCYMNGFKMTYPPFL
ncbi:unnamed protein product (macronuclear) [Paramecium tetraurelia]|uniref:CRC domain-containing protein n=1 Tax=Paramecium tetraurelia TaxID=5888 RepID=A0D9R6_PARTE|nr:uncharacterized protein GSPATT00014714001 [Paramecium tetraurelia]CAK79783.1 unnamed protein product [Paramecium tetraurelia]|eukprot:XP_001447180.1 hypothetical protein (macronuclear) [Paramecium tetraurelia strain d4-2]